MSDDRHVLLIGYWCVSLQVGTEVRLERCEYVAYFAVLYEWVCERVYMKSTQTRPPEWTLRCWRARRDKDRRMLRAAAVEASWWGRTMSAADTRGSTRGGWGCRMRRAREGTRASWRPRGRAAARRTRAHCTARPRRSPPRTRARRGTRTAAVWGAVCPARRSRWNSRWASSPTSSTRSAPQWAQAMPSIRCGESASVPLRIITCG